MANKISGVLAALNPPGFHTSHAAVAISTKSVVQTGPNTKAGGFHFGFSIVAYHWSISGVVAIAPIPPAPRQMAMQTINAIV